MNLKTFLFLSLLTTLSSTANTQIPPPLIEELPPVTKVLTPMWSQQLPAHQYDLLPVIYKEIAIPPTPGFFFNCVSGKKQQGITRTGKKLMVLKYFMRTKCYIEIIDPPDGLSKKKIKKEGPFFSNANSKTMIDDDFYFINNRNKIYKYNFSKDSIQLIKEFPYTIKSDIFIDGNNYLFSHNNQLIIGDTFMGNVTNEISFPDKISGMKKVDNLLYMWIVNRGVYCFNLETNQTIWTFEIDQSEVSNVEFIIDECLYFSTDNLYCIDLLQGNLYWKTVDNCSSKGEYNRIIGRYILRYNTCTIEGDHYPALIELLDKKTGQVLYQGWTSVYFPIDEELGVDLSIMDYYGPIIFANQLCGNMLIGIRDDMIFGFRLREE